MAGHSGSRLRGLDATALSSVKAGKFGRMFRWLPPAFSSDGRGDAPALRMFAELAVLMVTNDFDEHVENGGTSPDLLRNLTSSPDAPLTKDQPDRENPSIAAGYTYLGQFIDHDVTFDPASSLQKQNDPDTLEDFRTPRLDLDSLYGRGPDDQPYLYAKDPAGGDNRGTVRVRFRQGANCAPAGAQPRYDLPRDAEGTALVGDKRNDQNRIVSQLHGLFLALHNRVFEQLAAWYPGVSDPRRFLEAQRIVRWCYQWIVLNDFLPKICDAGVLDSIYGANRRSRPHFKFYLPKSGEAFIPVEFAAAAYRLGHSMVRPSYALNCSAHSTASFREDRRGNGYQFRRIPVFVGAPKTELDTLAGFTKLPEGWGIDWSLFFGQPRRDEEGRRLPQPSYRIDSRLVDPLRTLPPELAPETDRVYHSLAFRNLLRGFRLSLPSGQDVARALRLRPLRDGELWGRQRQGDAEPSEWAAGVAFYARHRDLLDGCAPLWFYVLKEAEMFKNGIQLGPVGSRIVAETLIGIAWHDHYSYLYQAPEWTPAEEGLPGLDEGLDMLALVQYAAP
jgi:hypothetical protein